MMLFAKGYEYDPRISTMVHPTQPHEAMPADALAQLVEHGIIGTQSNGRLGLLPAGQALAEDFAAVGSMAATVMPRRDLMDHEREHPMTESAEYPLPHEPNRHWPMQLYIGKPVLEQIVTDAIAAIRQRAPSIDAASENPVESKANTDFILNERENFLAWVQGHPGPNVYMTLYPASETELVDVEAADEDTVF